MQKKLILGLCSLLAFNSAFAVVNLSAKANSVTVFTGQRFGANGQFIMDIQNTTSSPQKYHIRAQLCPEKNKCEVQERNINILPNDRYKDTWNMSTSVFYNVSGVYKNYVGIYVTGAETNQALDTGVFTVYQRKA